MIWLSLKTYEKLTGKGALGLTLMAQKVSQQTQVPIRCCVQACDVFQVSQAVEDEVWVQHADPIDPGRHFGWTSPYSLKKAGASGVVLNHSEKPINKETIKKTLEKCHQYDLKVMVVCDSPELAKNVDLWDPDYISYEEYSLIAGEKAMIDERFDAIKELASQIKAPLVIGGSIETQAHVKKTLKAGGQGVFVASAVVKAKDPEKKLKELATGFLVN